MFGSPLLQGVFRQLSTKRNGWWVSTFSSRCRTGHARKHRQRQHFPFKIPLFEPKELGWWDVKICTGCGVTAHFCGLSHSAKVKCAHRVADTINMGHMPTKVLHFLIGCPCEHSHLRSPTRSLSMPERRFSSRCFFCSRAAISSSSACRSSSVIGPASVRLVSGCLELP